MMEVSVKVMTDPDPGVSKTSGSGSTTLVMPKVDIFMDKTECFAAATRFW
jgi:hypothetical protein